MQLKIDSTFGRSDSIQDIAKHFFSVYEEIKSRILCGAH